MFVAKRHRSGRERRTAVEREYIGIDLHKSFFRACAVRTTAEPCWEQRWPTTEGGVAALLARCGPQTFVAVEASSPTWAFVDRLVPHVGGVTIVDTRKTRIKAGYAAKTDQLDARRLADALRRDSVVSIYYPPPAIRDLRELVRYRCHLARMQASVKQRLHALLLRQGVATPSALFTQRGRRWLDTVTLTGWADAELRGLRQVLTDLRTQLVPVVTAIRTVAATDPVARALDRHPGFGPVFSVTLRAEIGTITRFPDGPHLASYAGLVPRVEQTSTRKWSGRITKTGSPWLRWILVEAALHQFRRQDAFGRWARRLALKAGALKARVAVARALCTEVVDLWPRG
jgi:transposase